MTREVPVIAEFAGSPAEGYTKAGHVIEPDQVTVTGPASEVATVRRATTGTIFLEGVTENLQVEVRPIPEAPEGSRVRVTQPRGPVRVRVIIEPPPSDEPEEKPAEELEQPGEAS